VLDFVHRMESKDGTTVSLRQAGLTLASICGLSVDGAQRRQEPRRARAAKETVPSTVPRPKRRSWSARARMRGHFDAQQALGLPAHPRSGASLPL
jgi:hypothetical protein